MAICGKCFWFSELGKCRNSASQKSGRELAFFCHACDLFEIKERYKMEQVKVEKKVCKGCGKELDIDAFARNRWGYTAYCRSCMGKLKRGEPLDGKREASEWPAEERPQKPQPEEVKVAIHEPEEKTKKPRKRNIENVPDEDLVAELRKRGFSGSLVKHTEFAL